MGARRPHHCARKSAALIGLGNIGLFTAQLIARMLEIGRVVCVDRDTYAPKNRIGQDISAAEACAGLPKALVAARRLRMIRPDLDVVGLHRPVEDVPRGLLRVDVILACLDSKRARMAVNEVASRLGLPWIDAGVQADGFLARVNVYGPGPDQPCLECAWDDRSYAEVDQVVPCQGGGGADNVPSTNAPACLGSLAASLQAIQCGHLIGGRSGQIAAGRQLVMDAGARRWYDVALRRNPACRFDHAAWQIRTLRQSPADLTIAEALCFGRPSPRVEPRATLAVEPKGFVRTLVCGCGARRELLKLSGRIPARLRACARCRGVMHPLGFATFSRLAAADFARRELSLPLARLGLEPGDIFTVTRGEQVLHCQLPLA